MAVNKKIPMRKCVGCGEMKPKKELIRILRTEEEFLVDVTGKKNGRKNHVYCCSSSVYDSGGRCDPCHERWKGDRTGKS